MNISNCLFKSVCTNTCSEQCMRLIQFNRLLELSNLPLAYQKRIVLHEPKEDAEAFATLDNIRMSITDFVKEGKCLYICSSNCGNAKTSWATRLMLRYFSENWKNSYDITRGLFVHIPTLLIDLKKFENRPEYIDRIKDADLVVFDDLAFSRLTDYEHEQLLQFIDYRVSNNLSCIFTSNIVDYNTLAQCVGGRIASRIYNGAKVVTFKAKDFRIGRNL